MQHLKFILVIKSYLSEKSNNSSNDLRNMR